MQPRVTAVLVARDGAATIERTLGALAAGTRLPDQLLVIDDASSDDSAARATRFAPTGSARLDQPRPYGQAVAHGLHVLTDEPTDDDWLWLLTHDSVPDRTALASLVAVVEVAPSVAVAGPKVMRGDEPTLIADFGQTVSRYGATVHLVVDELDQAQHDRTSDVLAVAGTGMLVRRRVWDAVGGFDPGLPSLDAALDFCVRVRLAGHRIVGVPRARVEAATPPQDFVRRVSARATHRIARHAQLHRRLVWAPAASVPFHWLSLLPFALGRSIGHLVGKRPGRIPGEIAAALAAAFDGGVAGARRNLARSRRLGWRAVAPLRMPPRELRRLRAHQRDLAAPPQTDATQRVRASFFASGGAWIVIAAVLAGVILSAPLLGAQAVAGGALAPLTQSIGSLWDAVGFGHHSVGIAHDGTGSIGASDPFAGVLALLGSLTFWSPSLSVVILWLLALPIAALGGWWAGSRFSDRGWAPALTAVGWAAAPPFLSDLATGHLPAVLAHLLLPWLVLALMAARHSWSGTATASLLMAAIAACSPSLLPLLLLVWVLLLVSKPSAMHRTLSVPIPALLIFVPLAIEQGTRGRWFALLADPGLPVAGGTTSGWQLALASPDAGAAGWAHVAALAGLPSGLGGVAAGVLVLPVILLALLGVALPGNGRSVIALAIALAGFVTAFIAAHVSVASVGADAVHLWTGTALSVYWLGILGAAAFALDRVRRRHVVPTLVGALALIALVIPALGEGFAGQRDVQASDGLLLPAYITAEVVTEPGLGTLVLEPLDDGTLAASVQRGRGATLEQQVTTASTDPSLSAGRRELADLAANITSRSGLDTAAILDRWGIGFVLVDRTQRSDAIPLRERATQALDANPALDVVGATSGGLLWRVTDAQGSPAASLTATEQTTRTIVRTGLLAVVLIALLVAIPTTRRRRATTVPTEQERAGAYDRDAYDGEDEDD